MKSLNIAIHGFGRIGRCFARALFESADAQITLVAISEPASAEAIAHLLKYDSAHGPFSCSVVQAQNSIEISGVPIRLIHEDDESRIDWGAVGVDLLIDCTGIPATRERGEMLLANGCKRVLFSQPGTADLDSTIVYGFNEYKLSADDRLISNASCTTNCVVPVIAALDKAFGIESGTTTTIHSAMHDQPVIDSFHSNDLRKTRSALHSIIPVDTALDRGIERLMPHLSGKFSSTALRVPTMNVSAIDLTLQLSVEVTEPEVNLLIERLAASNPRVAAVSSAALVSCDFNHSHHSFVADLSLTRVVGKLVKLHLWFDNEWGYASRLLDVANLMATQQHLSTSEELHVY